MEIDTFDNYAIGQRLARGAECVLYQADNGYTQFVVKAIRNGFGRIMGPKATKNDTAKLEDVSYAAKVRHLKNEYEVGQNLSQDGPIPVVRMYGMKKVKRCMVELGYDLLMERIGGRDLSDTKYLKLLSFEEKLDAFYQSAWGLRYIHQKGYIHLDIKPSNIMWTDGIVKYIDFGVSVPLGHSPRGITGTAGFLSPEQIAREFIDKSTDIFALGITFAVVFGGKRLRQEQADLQEKSSRKQALFMLENSDQPIVDDIPELREHPKLLELIKQCTVPMRDKRIKTANTLINSIKRYANELEIELTEPNY